MGLVLLVAGACSERRAPRVPADMQEVCARLSACGAPWEPLTFGSDCDGLMQLDVAGRADESLETRFALTFIDCVKLVRDCAGVEACLTASAGERSAVCRDGRTRGCAGDVAVTCGQASTDPAWAMRCGDMGMACFESANGAGCGLGTCEPGVTPSSCQGDRYLGCGYDVGALLPRDCSAGGLTGETCGMLDGGAGCVGTGEPCDEAVFQDRCEGAVGVTCTKGRTARFDCSMRPPELTCRVGLYGQAECAPQAAECDAAAEETCVDGVITYCSFGKVTSLDCKAYGLSGCALSDGDTGPRARCTE